MARKKGKNAYHNQLAIWLIIINVRLTNLQSVPGAVNGTNGSPI